VLCISESGNVIHSTESCKWTAELGKGENSKV